MKFFAPIKLSENMRETPEGFLLCLGVSIARTGDMVYGPGESPLETKNGKVIVSRSEKEVFRPETIASFEGKAVTIGHPTEFVGPGNWSTLTKGIVQNVHRGDGDQKDDLVADLLIMEQAAIFLVKNGLREVSCGYEAEYIQTAEGRGEQSGITGNHVALVDQGRAGASYAINDHSGKGSGMKLSEKIKGIFAKAADEAAKVADEFPPKKEEKKADDAAPPVEEKKAADAGAYDELVTMCKDLGSKIDAMAKKQGDAFPPKKEEEKPAADAPVDQPKSLEDRLAALEAVISKLTAPTDADPDMDAEDEFSEEADPAADAGMGVAVNMTGDTKSRVEILAPGLVPTKDAKAEALKAAYKTADGKTVIDMVTGGKPDFSKPAQVDLMFVTASEILKSRRSNDLSSTRKVRDAADSVSAGPMTAERLNEINSKHYANR